MKQQLFVLATSLLGLLSACTQPWDLYNYVEAKPVTIIATPLSAEVGEAVTVTVVGSLELDARSRVAERPVSDIAIGACFADGITTDGEGLTNPQGFCGEEKEALPKGYRILNGTDYYKPFKNIVLQRGQKREFKHEFTFTLLKTGRVVIAPNMKFWDKAYEGPDGSSNVPKNYPQIVFK